MLDGAQALAGPLLRRSYNNRVVEQPVTGTDDECLLGDRRLARLAEGHDQGLGGRRVPKANELFVKLRCGVRVAMREQDLMGEHAVTPELEQDLVAVHRIITSALLYRKPEHLPAEQEEQH